MVTDKSQDQQGELDQQESQWYNSSLDLKDQEPGEPMMSFQSESQWLETQEEPILKCLLSVSLLISSWPSNKEWTYISTSLPTTSHMK